jgi:threonine/homoserine/homoserine lactone efflux protein
MHELLGPLILFAAALCLTPGPNVVMVTASAANFGFRRVIPQMLGITLGFAVMIVAVGLGLAGVFQAEPRLHAGLKYVGALYLLYLAWRIARTSPTNGDGDSARAKPIGFVQATLFTWVNPKGWVTTMGALTAFTTADGNVVVETLVVAGVLATACFASVVMWAAFGTAIARFLRQSHARTAFNWSMAALLVLSLVPVFW